MTKFTNIIKDLTNRQSKIKSRSSDVIKKKRKKRKLKENHKTFKNHGLYILKHDSRSDRIM